MHFKPKRSLKSCVYAYRKEMYFREQESGGGVTAGGVGSPNERWTRCRPAFASLQPGAPRVELDFSQMWESVAAVVSVFEGT